MCNSAYSDVVHNAKTKLGLLMTDLKVLCYTFIVVVLTNCKTDSKNEIFGDGHYKIEYSDSSSYADYEISINNNSYTKKLLDGKTIRGQIDKLPTGLIVLKDFDVSNIETSDSLNDIQKWLVKLGPPCLQFENFKGDTIEFRMTYATNLHLTTGRGIIFQIED